MYMHTLIVTNASLTSLWKQDDSYSFAMAAENAYSELVDQISIGGGGTPQHRQTTPIAVSLWPQRQMTDHGTCPFLLLDVWPLPVLLIYFYVLWFGCTPVFICGFCMYFCMYRWIWFDVFVLCSQYINHMICRMPDVCLIYNVYYSGTSLNQIMFNRFIAWLNKLYALYKSYRINRQLVKRNSFDRSRGVGLARFYCIFGFDV